MIVRALREDRGNLSDTPGLHDWLLAHLAKKHPSAKHIVLTWKGRPLCGFVRSHAASAVEEE